MQFEEVCRENYARIYNYILAKTGSKEAAEDITQDVFLIAYQKGDEFLEHEKPIAFLYVTAKNLVLESFRQREKEKLSEEMEILSDSKDVFEEICRERAQRVDERQYQKQVLQKLTETEQQFYRKHYVEKKPMKAIAGEMGMSETAVRMKYVRLRKKVRGIVSDLRLDEF